MPHPTIEQDLVEAVKAGDREAVAAILDERPALCHHRTDSGVSLLLWAVYTGQHEIVDALLARSDEWDVFEAAATGQGPRLSALLADDPLAPHRCAPDGFFPLGLACFMGHLEAAEVLIAAGADVNAPARNPMQVRPLHSAAAHRDADASLALVQLLLVHGADPNVAQQGGWTPLHQAAAHGRAALAARLLAHGADAGAHSDDGRPPRAMAESAGHTALVALLEAHHEQSAAAPGAAKSAVELVPLSTYRGYDEAEMRARSYAFYQAARRRRTVRAFSDRPVPRAVIENCLRAAGTAPSGANLQPWHFVVIADADVKAKIREAAEVEERAFYNGRAPQAWLDALAALGTDANKPFLEVAPCLIAVFGEKYRLGPDGQKEKNYYTQESVGLATGMLITALHHAGLATLTHTPSPMGFLNELLGRPANERPFLLLVVGYPAEDAEVPDITKKPLSGFTTFL